MYVCVEQAAVLMLVLVCLAVDRSTDSHPLHQTQAPHKTTCTSPQVIHAVLPDGSTVKGVEVFRRVYDAIGLGWVYAGAQRADLVGGMGVHAKYSTNQPSTTPQNPTQSPRSPSSGASRTPPTTCGP